MCTLCGNPDFLKEKLKKSSSLQRVKKVMEAHKRSVHFVFKLAAEYSGEENSIRFQP